MNGRQRRALRRVAAIALPLGASASCVTPPPPPDTQARAPITDSQALLRELALTPMPPDDPKAAAALPARSVDRDEPLRAAPPFLLAARSDTDREQAVECLTAAVYYEARSEAPDGQRAVAQVVLNRVRDRAFPASVCGVVYQGSQRVTGCQFSFTCDGSMRARRDPAAWLRARAVAAAALAGSVFAPVGSATFYHTTAILPWWAPSLSRLTTIGAHIFYRWRTSMERALSFRQDYAGVERAAPAATLAIDGAAARVVQENAVTVHRGGSVAAPATAAAAPTMQAAAAPASPRLVLTAGVRIHRGNASSLAATDPPPPSTNPI